LFVAEADLFEQLTSATEALVLRPAEQARNERDVLFNAPMRQQSELLNNVTGAAPQFDRVEIRDVGAIQSDSSAGWLQRAVDQSQSCGFPGTAAAQKDKGLGAFDIKAEVFQDDATVDTVLDVTE
jgi:hypothetical protein